MVIIKQAEIRKQINNLRLQIQPARSNKLIWHARIIKRFHERTRVIVRAHKYCKITPWSFCVFFFDFQNLLYDFSYFPFEGSSMNMHDLSLTLELTLKFFFNPNFCFKPIRVVELNKMIGEIQNILL